MTDSERCDCGNNPYFHPKDCKARKSQQTPCAEDEPVFTPSRFTKWWPGDDPEAA